MKKAIAVVLVMVLAVGAFLAGREFGGREFGRYKPGYSLEKSAVYSDEDILKCAKLAEKDFRSGEVKCYPVKIYYSDKWLDYAESFLDQIDGVDKVQNILVIKADYLTGKETQSQEPYSYFDGWSFIFYRKDANSPWVLYSQGYA